MRIGRTVPPTAAPLGWRDFRHAVAGMWSPARAVRAREQEIRQHFAVRHVALVSSGTAALTIALMALRELSSRTAVVIPAFTCYSVPAAVMKAGLRPVLCDIDPFTFDFDHACLERMLTDETVCVIAQHLFGIPSNIEHLRAMCRSRGIFVVEDAAQAMGVRADEGDTGTLGDVGVFSLGRGKNITCGSGGIILTQHDRIAAAIDGQYRRLRCPSRTDMLKELVRLIAMAVFIRPSLYWIPAALPFLRLGETFFPETIPLRRLGGMKAGLLHHWRRRLRRSNRIRARNAADLSWRLSLNPPRGPSHPYLRLPLLASTPGDQKRICDASRRLGLGMSAAYPSSIDQLRQLRGFLDDRRFPCARKAAESLLTIPTHQWLSEKDKRAITRCLASRMRTASPTDVGRGGSLLEVAHHG